MKKWVTYITPEWIERWDKNQLLRYPDWWSLRLIPLLYYGIIYNVVLEILFILYPTNRRTMADNDLDGFVIFFLVILSFVGICFWLYNHGKFNGKLLYGLLNRNYEFKRTFVFLLAVVLISFPVLSFYLTKQAKIYQYVKNISSHKINEYQSDTYHFDRLFYSEKLFNYRLFYNETDHEYYWQEPGSQECYDLYAQYNSNRESYNCNAYNVTEVSSEELVINFQKINKRFGNPDYNFTTDQFIHIFHPSNRYVHVHGFEDVYPGGIINHLEQNLYQMDDAKSFFIQFKEDPHEVFTGITITLISFAYLFSFLTSLFQYFGIKRLLLGILFNLIYVAVWFLVLLPLEAFRIIQDETFFTLCLILIAVHIFVISLLIRTKFIRTPVLIYGQILQLFLAPVLLVLLLVAPYAWDIHKLYNIDRREWEYYMIIVAGILSVVAYFTWHTFLNLLSYRLYTIPSKK